MKTYSYKTLVLTDPDFREILRYKRLPFVREVIRHARFAKPTQSQYKLCKQHIREHWESTRKHRAGTRTEIVGTVTSIRRRKRNKAYDPYYILKDSDGYMFSGVVPKAIRDQVKIGDTVATVADTDTVKYSASLRIMTRPTRTVIL